VQFKIKICGVKSVADAVAAADAGADAIGLNFYPGSKRFIEPQLARQIVDAVGDRAEMIGLFVNEQASTICETCRAATLQIVQLHGDDSPKFGKLLIEFGTSPVAIIRAHNFGARAMEGVYASMFDATGQAADAVLVDATVSGQFGGTGHTIDWSQLVNYQNSIGKMPLILAGGLTPENVAEAIRTVRPHAVDVASGVESAPGKKDPAKMRDFVAAAREAFAAL
jgi:phosphoribosylanthranilate isomerase